MDLPTKNRVPFTILSLGVRANQRSKIVILDLLFVPTEKNESIMIAICAKRQHARFDKHPPALLPLYTLHPVLIQFN